MITSRGCGSHGLHHEKSRRRPACAGLQFAALRLQSEKPNLRRSSVGLHEERRDLHGVKLQRPREKLKLHRKKLQLRSAKTNLHPYHLLKRPENGRNFLEIINRQNSCESTCQKSCMELECGALLLVVLSSQYFEELPQILRSLFSASF